MAAKMLACTEPSMLLCIAIDGADQSALAIPYFCQETKESVTGWEIRMKLIGALVSGRMCVFYTLGSNWESGKSRTKTSHGLIGRACWRRMFTGRYCEQSFVRERLDVARVMRACFTDCRQRNNNIASWRCQLCNTPPYMLYLMFSFRRKPYDPGAS